MKRCPRCGRGYEEYWKVCLDDGEPLEEVKTIHRSPETELFKSLSMREAEEERRGVILFFIFAGLATAGFVSFVVAKFSGSVFAVIREKGAVRLFDTVMYNAGTLTALFVTAFLVTFPVWFFWWRKK